MKLQLVTITGADDLVAPESLLSLSCQFPFVEWAVLYYPTKEGSERNPTAAWREFFLSMDMPYTAAHLCGSQVFRDILDPHASKAVIADLKRYGRIQVNINVRRPEFTSEEVLSVYKTLQDAGLQLILQYHDSTKSIVESYIRGLDKERLARVDVLFDSSGGTGQKTIQWQAPLDFGHGPMYCGYAGGLGPVGLKDDIDRIGMAGPSTSDHPFWIDMETGVRTSNEFDLAKVSRVLGLSRLECEPYGKVA